MKTMKMLACLALTALAACGGNSGSAALAKNFDYGSPQTPSSSEQGAVATAQTNLQTSTSISTSPDANKGLALVAFVDVIAGAALGDATFGIRAPTSHELVRAIQDT